MLALLLAAPACAQTKQTTWKLLWADEFDGPANSAPDSAKWVYDLGRGQDGWGNAELESYTNSTVNVFLDGNGHLVIRAIADGSGAYTSARLKTVTKFSFTYGKVEARIRIPYGQGIWPAFWMLGSSISSTGWPACGEIDIMENIGKEPSTVHGTVHGPGYSGGRGITGTYALPSGKFSDDFHVFTAVWSPGRLEFLVDGKSYHTVTPASLPSGAAWVFSKPFFLLLNLAVGGRWPDRKSTRLNSSHIQKSRMPSSA